MNQDIDKTALEKARRAAYQEMYGGIAKRAFELGDTTLDRCTEAAIRAIEAARAPAKMGWGPISKAPKDGTELLLFAGWPRLGKWFRAYGSDGWWASNGMPVTPTHWMPLPVPPCVGDEKP